MEPTPKPKSYFGRILLLNLGLVVLLHAGRELLEPGSGIYGALFALVFVDFVLALILMVAGQSKTALSCLLAALLVGMAGFSDCASHFHLDTR